MTNVESVVVAEPPQAEWWWWWLVDWTTSLWTHSNAATSFPTWRRDLAAAATGPVKIDYNALSVAAMTLTLILMVDFGRDRLDRAARQRPFFRAVLEGVYTECTFGSLIHTGSRCECYAKELRDDWLFVWYSGTGSPQMTTNLTPTLVT
jgi:hypothetical protein